MTAAPPLSPSSPTSPLGEARGGDGRAGRRPILFSRPPPMTAARFSGTCRRCRGPFGAGDPIESDGEGWIHARTCPRAPPRSARERWDEGDFAEAVKEFARRPDLQAALRRAMEPGPPDHLSPLWTGSPEAHRLTSASGPSLFKNAPGRAPGIEEGR